MKILKKMLFISAFPPNHKSGGQTYSYNALNDLKKNYDIDLIYFDFPEHEYENVDGVRVLGHFRPSKWGCLQMPLLYPRFTRRFSYKTLNYIKKIANNYDCILFDHSQVATYSLFIKHKCKIVRCHDILGQKYKREESKLLPWILFSERLILNSVAKIFTPSFKDVQAVKKLYGLSAEYTNEYLTYFEIPKNVSINETFIFFGLWSRYENINGLMWFVKNVYQPNKKRLNNKIVVMGGGLSQKENEILKRNGIKYLGYVKNSYAELVHYKAVIVPLFEGAGIKVKVLDAFNTGTPVIGTNIAFEGIKDLKGLTYCANSPEEFIQAMDSIPMSSGEKKREKQKEFLDYYDKRHLSDFL